ncbi:MAG: hypothetical protein ACC656_03790, partial [Candidatus Heimdallarchaeota archaeon]
NDSKKLSEKKREKLYDEIDTVRSFSSDENEEIIKERDKLKQEIIKSELSLKVSQDKSIVLKRDMEDLQKDYTQILTKFENMDLEIKRLEVEKQNFIKEIDSSKEEIGNLMSQVTENEIQSMTNLSSAQDIEFEKTSLESEMNQWKKQYQRLKSTYEQFKITTEAQLSEYKSLSFNNKKLDRFKTAITIMRDILEREPYYAILSRLQERKSMTIKELTALTATEPVLFKRTLNLLNNEGWVEVKGTEVNLKKEFLPI